MNPKTQHTAETHQERTVIRNMEDLIRCAKMPTAPAGSDIVLIAEAHLCSIDRLSINSWHYLPWYEDRQLYQLFINLKRHTIQAFEQPCVMHKLPSHYAVALHVRPLPEPAATESLLLSHPDSTACNLMYCCDWMFWPIDVSFRLRWPAYTFKISHLSKI